LAAALLLVSMRNTGKVPLNIDGERGEPFHGHSKLEEHDNELQTVDVNKVGGSRLDRAGRGCRRRRRGCLHRQGWWCASHEG
jgi:hypothetical protein